MFSRRLNNKILFFLSFFVLSGSFSQENAVYIDGISAVVGDHILLKSDLSQLVTMTAIQQGLNPQENYDKIVQLQEEILLSLIDQKVLLEMAKIDSIEIKEKEVTQSLEMQVDNIVMQAGSEEKAEELLGQTIRSFKREYWPDMRDRLITERYQQTLMNDIKITRDELIEFFNTYEDSLPFFPSKVKLSHILLPVDAGEENTQKIVSKLDSIKKEILNGLSFEDAAKTYSQDPGSRDLGGSLGFVRRGSLVPSFEKTAFTLNVGAISDPVKSAFGYHLIQTIEKRGDKINVRHILLIPEITMDDDSRAYSSAQTLADSLKTLETFKSFAGKYSVDEKTKGVGGSLGWIEPDSYPIREISEVIPYLTKDACSPPVKSDYGYHLIWLENIKAGGKPQLSTHYLELEEMALNYKKMQWYQGWIEKARKKFYIEVYN